MNETKSAAQEWVKNGRPCYFCYGWRWKGAQPRPMTQQEAEKKLPRFDFGKGFWSLYWSKVEGEDVLMFNELSENDMW